MIDRVQVYRSPTAGNRPPGGHQPGELYVNFADLQLGMVNASNANQDLIGVTFFSATTSYAIGRYVVQGAFIYRAIAAVTPAAFNASQWSQVATLADVTTAVSGVVANPNRLDNGDMWVDQHNSGASAAIPAAGWIWTPDRWATFNTKAKFTVGQNYATVLKAPNFPYFLGVQTTGTGAAPAAADINYTGQSIEFDTFNDFAWGTANAQPATLSFWVNSSLTGNFSVAVQGQVSPNRIFITTYNVSTANTWTKITIPIPADTTVSSTNWTGAGNAPGLVVIFDFGCGATSQTSTGLGAWQNSATVAVASGAVKLVATSNAKFAITGVKLERGSVATAYPTEDLARKLARCQRYYQRYTSGANAMVYPVFPANVGGVLPIPPMRAAPTCSLIGTWAYGPSTSAAVFAGAAPNTIITYAAYSGAANSYYYISANGSGWDASAEI